MIYAIHTQFLSEHSAIKLTLFDNNTAQMQVMSGADTVAVALDAEDMAQMVWAMAAHLPLADRMELGLATPEEMGYTQG